MALHHKPKRDESAEPERCLRCGARLGASALDFMPANDSPLARNERTAWLCEPCRRDVRRRSAEN